jgi:hypothetical protein
MKLFTIRAAITVALAGLVIAAHVAGGPLHELLRHIHGG